MGYLSRQPQGRRSGGSCGTAAATSAVSSGRPRHTCQGEPSQSLEAFFGGSFSSTETGITFTKTVLFFSRYLYLLFHFPVLFIFLILDRTSRTMLNSSGEGGHPYLVPYLRIKASSSSQLSMMLTVVL